MSLGLVVTQLQDGMERANLELAECTVVSHMLSVLGSGDELLARGAPRDAAPPQHLTTSACSSCCVWCTNTMRGLCSPTQTPSRSMSPHSRHLCLPALVSTPAPCHWSLQWDESGEKMEAGKHRSLACGLILLEGVRVGLREPLKVFIHNAQQLLQVLLLAQWSLQWDDPGPQKLAEVMSLGTLACSHSHLAAEYSWVRQRPGKQACGERVILSNEPALAQWASNPPILYKPAPMVYSTRMADSQTVLEAARAA